LIDPALVDELNQMAAGYLVITEEETEPVEGLGVDLAVAALDRISRLVIGGGAYRTMMGNPDLNALALMPQASTIFNLAGSVSDQHLLSALPLAIWAGQDKLPESTERLLTRTAPDFIISQALLSRKTVQRRTDGPSWVALTPLQKLPEAGVSFATPPPFQAQTTRQAYLAIADSRRTPVVVLVNDEADAVTALTWLNQGWQPTLINQAIGWAAVSNLDWADSEIPDIDLPRGLRTTINQVDQELTLLADLGDAPDEAATMKRWLLTGATSSTWNGNWAEARTWLRQATEPLKSSVGTGQIELHVANQWRLSPNDNTMPISISNTMGIPVCLRIHFVSENPIRLSISDSEEITVEADSTATVNVSPQAAGNGLVQVWVSLQSCSGTSIGSPAVVAVVITSAGRFGWIIVIGSGLAFVIATSLRVRQVRRQRRQDSEIPLEQETTTSA